MSADDPGTDISTEAVGSSSPARVPGARESGDRTPD